MTVVQLQINDSQKSLLTLLRSYLHCELWMFVLSTTVLLIQCVDVGERLYFVAIHDLIYMGINVPLKTGVCV